MSGIIVWADIPVIDMARARAFYAHLTGEAVQAMPGVDDVAVIGSPGPDGESVVSADLYIGGTPSADGCTIYFSANGDMDGMLARAAEAGGTVVRESAFMGPQVGWVAFVLDTEGNRIGIQQPGE